MKIIYLFMGYTTYMFDSFITLIVFKFSIVAIQESAFAGRRYCFIHLQSSHFRLGYEMLLRGII